MGPPGDDPRRRFSLPMDLIFDKVCSLLQRLAGRTQVSPQSKNASASGVSSPHGASGPGVPPFPAANVAAAKVKSSAAGATSVTRDTLQQSLVRHKHMALRFVLACLAPVLGGTSGLAAMTEQDVIAAEKKCRQEEGGGDMLDRPPEAFREAVLPDYLRYKAQYAHKVNALVEGWGWGGRENGFLGLAREISLFFSSSNGCRDRWSYVGRRVCCLSTRVKDRARERDGPSSLWRPHGSSVEQAGETRA